MRVDSTRFDVNQLRQKAGIDKKPQDYRARLSPTRTRHHVSLLEPGRAWWEAINSGDDDQADLVEPFPSAFLLFRLVGQLEHSMSIVACERRTQRGGLEPGYPHLSRG